MALTYAEMRTNAQQIVDEDAKEAVLRGIEVLTKEYGEDWVSKIDTDMFDIASGVACVLGQVYGDAGPTDSALAEAEVKLGYGSDEWEEMDGYERGLCLLDGDVVEHPALYGFNERNYHDRNGASYSELQSAWLAVFGLVVEPV